MRKIASAGPRINYQAEVTCRKTCGWQVFAIGFLVLSVAAFHIVVLIMFFNNGKTFDDRPAVSIFLVLSVLFMLIIVQFLVLWKKKVKRWVKQKFGPTLSSAKRPKKGIFGYYRWYIDNCGLDGKYYLWRLFGYEIFEHCVQFRNMISIYSCTLPLEMNMVICVLLAGEAGYRAWIFKDSIFSDHNLTVAERNFQVVLDIILDLFFMSSCYDSSWYKVPLTVKGLADSVTQLWLVQQVKTHGEECMREIRRNIFCKNKIWL